MLVKFPLKNIQKSDQYLKRSEMRESNLLISLKDTTAAKQPDIEQQNETRTVLLMCTRNMCSRSSVPEICAVEQMRITLKI